MVTNTELFIPHYVVLLGQAHYRKYCELSYEKVGERFNKSKQGIYDSLKRADWGIIEFSENTLLNLLFDYSKSNTYTQSPEVKIIPFISGSKSDFNYRRYILENNNNR